MSMLYNLRFASNDQISQLIIDPDTIEEWLFNEESAVDAKLEKSWHGIHYLLTGSQWEGKEPYCYLLSGGETIGDIDVGYGPARALRPDKLKDFNAALSEIDRAELRKKYDKKSLLSNEIYPSVWNQGSDDDNFDYLYSNFVTLKEFLREGAQKSYGAIVWLE
ncbi:MAG: YfbM family protein [Candidatus Obscuribacterales bacterium]|nr:YfbM family protein [Cyanobacteria bacterium HKST-UBA01]MCB9469959.1 YfbM family protein [Candidatus Obscuribacterales bacterium]